MSKLPTPTAEERSALDFDARKWALRWGVCPYHGGEHEFAGQSYCRLCREERQDLVAPAWAGELFEK